MNDFKSVYLKQQADKAPEVGAYLFYKVHFSFGQSKTITDYSKQRLDELVGYLEHFPKCVISLEAHADYIGSEEESYKIAFERGEVVFNYLKSKAIDFSRLKRLTKEEQVKLIAQDEKEENQKSRRVEFKVLSVK